MRRNQKSKIKNQKLCAVRILNSKRGLTLIEVMVSLTVLAIGLLGVALMQVSSISGNTFSRELAVATELGQDLLEKINAMDYGDPGVAGGPSPGTDHPTGTDVSNDLAPTVFTDPDNNVIDERGLWPGLAATLGTASGPLVYTRTWLVIDDDPVPGMKNITVTVSWQEETLTREVQISAVKVQP